MCRHPRSRHPHGRRQDHYPARAQGLQQGALPFLALACLPPLVIELTPLSFLHSPLQGMIHATRSIIAKNGAGALLTGLGPTIVRPPFVLVAFTGRLLTPFQHFLLAQVGYSIQGAFKFGGYEFWKKQAIDYYGVEGARNNRQIIYLGSSAIAEFFADVALCVRYLLPSRFPSVCD